MFSHSKIFIAILSAACISCIAPILPASPQQSIGTSDSSRRIFLQTATQDQEAQDQETQDPVQDQPTTQDTTPREPARPRDQITIEMIDEELAKVEQAELEETEKGTIVKLYVDARQNLALANTDQAAAAEYRLEATDSINQRSQAREALEKIDSAKPMPLNVRGSIEELEKRKLDLENEVDAIQKQLTLATEEPTRRRQRLLDFPQLENDAQTDLARVRQQLATEAPEGDNPLLTRGRMVSLRTERQKLERNLELLKVERDAYEASTGIFPLKQELKTKQLANTNRELAAVVEAIGRLREKEVDSLISQAQADVDRATSTNAATATRNLELARQLEVETDALQTSKSWRSSGQLAVQKIESEFKTMQSRVEEIGLSYEVGAMLRRDKSELIHRRTPFQNVDIADQLQAAQLNKYKWQDERADLPVTIEAIERSIADLRQRKLSSQTNPEQTESAKKEQDALNQNILDRETELQLLKDRRKLLGKLEDTDTDLFHNLFKVQSLQTQFTNGRREFADFLDESIIWVRSEPVLGFSDSDSDSGKIKTDLDGIRKAASWFGDFNNWRSVARSISNGAKSRFPGVTLVAIGLLGLTLLQPRSRSELKRQGLVAVKRSSREFSPTVSSFLQTVVLSFFWPAVGLALGWLITAHTANSFAWSVGRGLTVTSLVAFPFELMRCVCRKEGLAQNHFSWAEGFRVAVRKHSGWFMASALPLLFLIVTIEASNEGEHNRLGRVAMLALLAVSVVFAYRIFTVFRPGGSAHDPDMNGFDATVSRLRSFVFVAIVIGLAMLFLFAVLGYYESVYKIGTSLLQTVILLIGTVIAFGFVMRFFLVRRRKLRYEQLIQQRKAAIAAAEKQAESGMSIATEALDIDLQNESGMDITDVSRQARELTGVIFLIVIALTLLGIWQYLLPATKILDSWELWRITVGSVVEFVTARDLLLSLIAFALTFFSVRNIPGMLELLLLQRLPLDAGARYAVASIFRYILLVVGVIIALGYLKIPWSNYSWLVAAISVGLGFGLQEIVANFVSGLILLLERPVRVGDVVTIDNVTGVVSRIQMRATTITNWDNQELVVPNKDLISGKLLNWTLSSVINRIALKVGVAYGTDIAKVRELITKIVERHPDVLNEPAAVITFEEFGDSSLNFVIRCCTTSIKRRWNLVDEINSAVNEAFEREGIEIPFPQRVVHMIEEPAQSPEAADTPIEE